MGFFNDVLGAVGAGASALGGMGIIKNPLVAGALTGGGALFNSLGASASQREMNAQMMDFQREMQTNQQQFNAEQSQLQRDWQAEQNSIMNDFNASEAQKARDFTERMNDPAVQLRKQLAAGVNPLAGDMGAGSVSASPQASASGIGGGAEAQSGLLGAPSSIQNPALVAAQVRLMNAQANKLDVDADTDRTMKPLKIKGSLANIEYFGSKSSEAEANAQLLNEKLNEVVANTAMLNALKNFHSMKADEIAKNLMKFDDRWNMEVKKFEDESGLRILNANEIWSQIVKNLSSVETDKELQKLYRKQGKYYDNLGDYYDTLNESEKASLFFKNLDIKYMTTEHWNPDIQSFETGEDSYFRLKTKEVNGKLTFIDSQTSGNKRTIQQNRIFTDWGDGLNTAFGVIDGICSIAGRVFGANVSYGSYSSSSVSNVTSNSTSHSTVNSTSHNTNHNYNHRHGKSR